MKFVAGDISSASRLNKEDLTSRAAQRGKGDLFCCHH